MHQSHLSLAELNSTEHFYVFTCLFSVLNEMTVKEDMKNIKSSPAHK